MNPPSTERQPTPLPEKLRQQLLRWRAEDRKDPFAGDPNDTISELGRLVLHGKKAKEPIEMQFFVDAYFALGDLCALRVLNDEELLVFYAGKVLIAYEQAHKNSTHQVDRMKAENAIGDFLMWILQMAQTYPTERNIAVALWASAYSATDITPHPNIDQRLINQLIMRYAPKQVDDHETHADTNPTPPQSVYDQKTPTETQHAGTRRKLSNDSQSDSQTRVADDILDETALSQFDDLSQVLPEASSPRNMPTHIADSYADDGTMFNNGVSDDGDAFLSVEKPLEHIDEVKAPLYHRPEKDKRSGQNDFEVGAHISGRYEVVDYRTGGMGIVYLCYDHEQHEPVAIKSFQKRFLDNERAVARFEKEAYAWIRLDKHPNIVQARRVQTINERPHILLEHVSPNEGMGVDLRSWLDQSRLPLGQALSFSLQIARAMRHACERISGLVHRDLKPANILISHDLLAKVTDFGLVSSLERDTPVSFAGLKEPSPPQHSDQHPDDQASDALTSITDADAGDYLPDRLTRDNAMVGTPPYMSPEQCLAQDVDERADIYAFGIVLYEMLTGKHPFTARGMLGWRDAHLHTHPYFSEDTLHYVPADVRTFVLKCLEKPRERRPQSWGEVEATITDLYQVHVGEIPMIEMDGLALEMRELMDKGYSLTELGRYEEALIAYDQALSLDTDTAWAWARKGRTLRLLGQFQEAIDCYDRALTISPNYAWALAGKGIILNRLNHTEEALHYFELATEANPDDIWYWYNRGSTLQELGRDDEALSILEQGLKLDHHHVSSLAKIGQIHRLNQRHEQAISAYQQALEHDPTYAWAWNGLGLSQKIIGKYDEAIISFKNAVLHETGVVWHWYNLADTLIQTGRYQDALQPVREALRIAPDYAACWAKLGQILRYQRQYTEAIEAYDEAITHDHNFDWAYNGKGIVLEQLEQLEEALALYRKATELNPKSEWYTYNTAKILTSLGQYDEAHESAQQSIHLNPDFARAWALIGKIKREKNLLEDAVKASQQALKIAPNYAWGWHELGMTFEALKQYNEALNAYRTASKYAPKIAENFYKQADIYLQLKRYNEALSTLQQALAINNRKAYFWAKHGQILRKLERLEESLTSYTRAVNLDPDYSWAWSGHGLVLSAMGNHLAAIESFERAIALKNDDVWYWYNYAEELLAIKREKSALEALEEALEIDPTHAESWAKCGQALRALGRYEESLQAYNKAIEINPVYGWAWNGKGQTLRAVGRYHDAIEAYDKAIEIDPSMIWYYFNKLTVLLDIGRREDGLTLMEYVVSIAPDNSVAWARHGQVLRRLHQFEQALDSYDRALVLDSQYAWAWNGKGMCLGALQRWQDAAECFQRAVYYNDRDVWFWHNYGEALEKINRLDKSEYAMKRALELVPNHSHTIEKLISIQRRIREQSQSQSNTPHPSQSNTPHPSHPQDADPNQRSGDEDFKTQIDDGNPDDE